MQIPTNFTKTIKKVFYDKEITLYDVTETVDAEGRAEQGTPVANGSFFASVNFNRLETVRQEYGISEEINLTLNTDATVPNEQIIGYDGKFYKVIQSIPFDSHRMLIAQDWS